ncbi:MAG: DUF2807 domain-containing protein [Massilia sp.]
MTILSRSVLAGAALCAALSAAHAASATPAASSPDSRAGADARQSDARLSESRPVDARVTRVKLEGVVNLKLRQGPVAALVLSGDRRWVGQTRTSQSGGTLTIESEFHGSFTTGANRNGPNVTAELTLPSLREVDSESLGWTEISGFSGDKLVLVQEGAGAIKVDASYRLVKATLGGLGSMQIDSGNGEGIELDMQGAGLVKLLGRSKWIKASMGGLGALDAQQCEADAVDLDLSGLGSATITARRDAKLSLSGLGSVTVYGKPASRNVSVEGLGKVSWK